MGKAGPQGRVPLEALILAFAHSRAKALVGTDALRSVLSGEYRELQKGGEFDLEPVWQLLAQQPGFDPTHVRPPLCRFKSWESQLGLVVLLPAEMAGLSELERNELAGHVHVPAHERQRVLQGQQVQSDDPVAAAAAREEEARPPPRAEVPVPIPTTARTPRLRRLNPAQRRALEIGALVLALFGFALAGIQLQRGCASHQWDEMATRFAGDIPLASAQRQGPEVSGDLRDARWLSQPPGVRTAHMKAALEALPHDVQVFFVRDREGQVRAVARWFGTPRQISVTLQ
ncbi:MAG TPA: hypothetical protein VNO33_08290 [Kofleriaceae bacterium]|nr:hypothetical protein [Kofleriaceae bacterium]